MNTSPSNGKVLDLLDLLSITEKVCWKCCTYIRKTNRETRRSVSASTWGKRERQAPLNLFLTIVAPENRTMLGIQIDGLAPLFYTILPFAFSIAQLSTLLRQTHKLNAFLSPPALSGHFPRGPLRSQSVVFPIPALRTWGRGVSSFGLFPASKLPEYLILPTSQGDQKKMSRNTLSFVTGNQNKLREVSILTTSSRFSF